MVREAAYDEVFDSQCHFRSILDSMARPGKINDLKRLGFEPPQSLLSATTAVCLSLLNQDVSFYMARGNPASEEFLKVNTGSRSADLEEADFIIVDEDESPDLVRLVKEGLLTYPEEGATIILQTKGFEDEQADGFQGIRLEGPGIDGVMELHVRGLGLEWIEALRAKNSEFPLGVDLILVSDSEPGEQKVACIPRSSRIHPI
ncbi:phosphonate C-P lyase system protein PhnH [Candidatus Pelagisphaera phototrophica]|uniref:phosphonate C-P lyase system protein PhnH n=1 Tax=Candidatus Pelagisphaera phototrophica TaxID=2684113 RepID=UPI0019EA5B68|nr:phosphonate C-P lyase system protein PhnH [Candidatus Pelagisphaera phototrophica]QXD31719.1 phosphonate C-P lyase system protein PhnH [Candidatus Pelagisphaera phototrophica]